MKNLNKIIIKITRSIELFFNSKIRTLKIIYTVGKGSKFLEKIKKKKLN